MHTSIVQMISICRLKVSQVSYMQNAARGREQTSIDTDELFHRARKLRPPIGGKSITDRTAVYPRCYARTPRTRRVRIYPRLGTFRPLYCIDLEAT